MEEKDKKVVFISGTNRGIGFELTLQMAENNYTVIAGYRTEESSKHLFEEANRKENIIPIKVDVTSDEHLKNLYDFIQTEFDYLDILINSAGINLKPSTKISNLKWEDIANTIETNIGGPFRSTKTLFPLIKKSNLRKIINISSIMGSIRLTNGGATPYRISKSGLNMLMKNQSLEYKDNEITVVSIHPGWVKTDMGGSSATMTVKESAKKIIEIIERISLNDSGEFISVNGDIIPF
jgi:NAD(P)-dependent dehydrogenase (short-subunit alcohol dehydrogenase family)